MIGTLSRTRKMKNEQAIGRFMTEVMNRANILSLERNGRPLSDMYGAPSTTLKMIEAITNIGWLPFKALSGLLTNSSFFAFTAARTLFILSPLGQVVVNALAYWDGKDSLKLLYNNHSLVVDIERIGDKYSERVEASQSDEERNILADEAAETLYALKFKRS